MRYEVPGARGPDVGIPEAAAYAATPAAGASLSRSVSLSVPLPLVYLDGDDEPSLDRDWPVAKEKEAGEPMAAAPASAPQPCCDARRPFADDCVTVVFEEAEKRPGKVLFNFVSRCFGAPFSSSEPEPASEDAEDGDSDDVASAESLAARSVALIYRCG